MKLAADICLPKMIAGLLSRPKRHFTVSKITGIYFPFITKIPGATLLRKRPAKLPSTEQIFAETTRLVPLYLGPHATSYWTRLFLPAMVTYSFRDFFC